jgi:hypothetical protein
MVTSSRYVHHGATRCAYCNAPFRSHNGAVEFWRAANGEHFCSEFCADDAEEARFRRHRAHSRPAESGADRSARI